jgi:hypothetical protein
VKTAWPQVRAALVLFHVLAVLVLSLPGPAISNEAAWNTRVAKTDLDDWSRSLGSEPDDFRSRLRSIALGWVEVRNALATPFRPYASYTQMTQSWAMFASPQRNPTELHLIGDVGRGFDVPLYKPHDPSAALFDEWLSHNRLRKLRGRFGRRAPGKSYDELARYLARRACDARPDLVRVKVALWAYRSLGPADRAQRKSPNGKYEHERIHPCEAAR